MKQFSFTLSLLSVVGLLFIPQLSFGQEEEPHPQDTIRKIVIEVNDVGIDGFVPVMQEPTPINMDSVVQVIGYPRKAVRKNIQGQVIVRIMVDESGQYLKHQIIRPVHPILDEAIEAELPSLRFTPAIDADGQAIKFWVNIPFNFRLR